MKNRHSAILVLITCMFASFTLGFLTGRTTAPGDTIVSQTSKAAIAPEVTSATEIPSNYTTEAETETDTTPETIPTTVPTTVPPAVSDTTDPTAPATEPVSNLININTATLAQLDTLPGIGPVIAQRIIDYREAHGPFTAVSQLTLVEGIGPKRLAAIIDLITIE